MTTFILCILALAIGFVLGLRFSKDVEEQLSKLMLELEAIYVLLHTAVDKGEAEMKQAVVKALDKIKAAVE